MELKNEPVQPNGTAVGGKRNNIHERILRVPVASSVESVFRIKNQRKGQR
jgi:hypothetical protein